MNAGQGDNRNGAADAIAAAVGVAIEQLARIESATADTGPNAATSADDTDYSNGIAVTDIQDLRLSFPGIAASTFVNWLGPRLVLWPRDFRSLHRTSIVASRIGKRPDSRPEWFDALRTAALRCDPDSGCLCYAPGTSAAEAVSRVSLLFGIPRLRIEVAAKPIVKEAGLIDWVKESVDVATGGATSRESVVHVSPEIKPLSEQRTSPQRQMDSSSMLPVADAALMLVAQRIIVLSCRSGGNVDQLLQRYLRCKILHAPVLLAEVDRVATAASESLVTLGAIPWLLERDLDSLDRDLPSNETTENAKPQRGNNSAKVASVGCAPKSGPLECPDEWLCHWTRARHGAWMDQPADDFWDELILGCPTADRSAFAALLRIVMQKRILATRAIQGAAATVSWTAVPLAEFRSRRIYRKHKQQFDFEPWGIALRKSNLQAAGARQVEYFDAPFEDASIAQTGAEFRQPRYNQNQTIDWSEEREWRISGDVDLQKLATDDAMLFVDTAEEAESLRRISAWPVIEVPLL